VEIRYVFESVFSLDIDCYRFVCDDDRVVAELRNETVDFGSGSEHVRNFWKPSVKMSGVGKKQICLSLKYRPLLC